MNRPPIPAPPYAGGCLCGQARYTIGSAPMAVNACHCDDCKKLTGATHLLMIVAERADFSATGETTIYRKTADSGRQIDIHRCSACGTRLWHEPLAAPKLVYVAAGTLDNPHWAVPASHIYVDRISPGVAVQDDALKVGGQPAERSMIMDAFTKIYGPQS